MARQILSKPAINNYCRTLIPGNVNSSGRFSVIKLNGKSIQKCCYRTSPVAQLVSASNKAKTEGQNGGDKNSVTLVKKPSIVKALAGVMKTYDFLTYPVYTMAQQPGKKLARHNALKAKRSDEAPNEWQSVLPKCPKSMELQTQGLDTLEKLFDYGMKKYRDKPCLGTRPLLDQVVVKDRNGVPVVKKRLGDYQWKNFGEVQTISVHLSRSLIDVIGLKSRDTIAIFADTREEWLLTAIAAFKANLAIATVFTTLGDDGVVSALNETGIDCLFTTEDLMPRCYELLNQTPNIKRLVCMERPNSKTPVDLSRIPPTIQVLDWSSLVKKGEELARTKSQVPERPKPGPEDTAIIMYTSGSTGVPKGVILSHKNAASVLGGMVDAVYSVTESHCDDESYLAFLPLAHILELGSEANAFLVGAKIGYGTPLTITDASPGVMEGTKGDAPLLQPTCMAVVPLVLERINKSVYGKLDAPGSESLRHVFDFLVNYKMDWVRRGYSTPLLDKLFFSKFTQVVGGKMRLIICGGAHLASQTEELIRTIFCTQVLVGYGLTETSGCASCCVAQDLTVGRSGSASNGITLRLVDWEEGGYRVTDQPFPRGELIIGGPIVAKGYFKRESDDFFSERGQRWFKSGDIVEVHDDGVICIIDRKKDLVKLSNGKFLSLGKVESILKTSPLVESICVCANSTLSGPVAIIVPGQIQVEELATKLRITGKSFAELTQDPRIVEEVLLKIHEHAKTHLLINTEIPQHIHLSPDPWTPNSGLVTASLKLKRANIHIKFKPQIEQLMDQVRKNM